MKRAIILLVFILVFAAGIFILVNKKIGESEIFPGTEQSTTTLEVFFGNNNLDPEISCNKVFPAERIILKTQTPARKAIEFLLEGPTQSEKDSGYFTTINSGVKINSLSVEGGIARVDFDKQLEFQVGGSCRVAAIRAQITQTLRQFLTVDDVVISINGRIEDILQP